MSTTTANPTRPPFTAQRVFWQTSTYGVAISIGTTVDPTTPDIGPRPDGTVPVVSHGVVCHVAPARLRPLPVPPGS